MGNTVLSFFRGAFEISEGTKDGLAVTTLTLFSKPVIINAALGDYSLKAEFIGSKLIW